MADAMVSSLVRSVFAASRSASSRHTGPKRRCSARVVQLVRFNGKAWVRFGEVLGKYMPRLCDRLNQQYFGGRLSSPALSHLASLDAEREDVRQFVARCSRS
jgi:hypothetical protein